jgi:hypothetical protein
MYKSCWRIKEIAFEIGIFRPIWHKSKLRKVLLLLLLLLQIDSLCLIKHRNKGQNS